ncbi:MAG: hypothetical protein ACTSXP_17745 [Promethearchaeota archaeon]
MQKLCISMRIFVLISILSFLLVSTSISGTCGKNTWIGPNDFKLARKKHFK